MDPKTLTLLLTAKYGGYLVTLFIIMNFSTPNTAVVSTYMLAFAVDSIRHFYLDNRNKTLALYSLYLQFGFILAFTFLDRSGIAVVLYIIIVTESLIAFPLPVGRLVFLLSLGSFALSSIFIGLVQGRPFTEVLSISVINSMVLVFAFGVSYMARKQFEEKERAEEALEKLEASRRELERTYRQLLNHSKQQERMLLVEERNRIAREIHDTLAHSLTSIIVGMEAAKKLLDKDLDRARLELEKSQEQARRGLDDVRRSVKALRPRTLEEQGFSDALRALSRDYGEQGVQVDIRMDGELDIPEKYELPFFRVIQECLTNSLRHGGASRVLVSFEKVGDSLALVVKDNGTGCEALVEGSGLMGIRERLKAVGGRVEILSRARDGETGFAVKSTIKGVFS